jgi:hypothetical protein
MLYRNQGGEQIRVNSLEEFQVLKLSEMQKVLLDGGVPLSQKFACTKAFLQRTFVEENEAATKAKLEEMVKKGNQGVLEFVDYKLELVNNALNGLTSDPETLTSEHLTASANFARHRVETWNTLRDSVAETLSELERLNSLKRD